MNDKLKKLLKDFYTLGVEDGIARHQYECVADDYDAETWFELIKNYAKKYNVKIKDYNDWDPWDMADDLNFYVTKEIINQISKLIKD